MARYFTFDTYDARAPAHVHRRNSILDALQSGSLNMVADGFNRGAVPGVWFLSGNRDDKTRTLHAPGGGTVVMKGDEIVSFSGFGKIDGPVPAGFDQKRAMEIAAAALMRVDRAVQKHGPA